MKGISHSLWRKLVVTLIAGVGFVLLYQATIFDSRYAARQALMREDTADPGPGTRLRFLATAYCRGEVTASGVPPRSGIAAADPEILPVGSVVQLVRGAAGHEGVYTVMDTGPVVKGRRLDLYVWNCDEALRFGRRSVQLVVLRLGWNPAASGPTILDKLLPWRK
ncbi:MAG: hypothetical protein H6Q10_532 [Acidobacteria bacterium]|nr:hypothetical protein [Acidobacteriota bacterium]